MARTAIFRDDLFMEHDPGYSHVESPDRLRVIYEELDQAGEDHQADSDREDGHGLKIGHVVLRKQSGDSADHAGQDAQQRGQVSEDSQQLVHGVTPTSDLLVRILG